jgi:hypothetical protein
LPMAKAIGVRFSSRQKAKTKTPQKRRFYFCIITQFLIQKCRGVFFCTTRPFWCISNSLVQT